MRSFENPFASSKPRKPNTSEFFGKILGDAERKKFDEMMDQKTSHEKKKDDFSDMTLSAEEKAIAEHEIKKESPWDMARLTTWAMGFCENEAKAKEWVKSEFEFSPDGTFYCMFDLELRNKKVTELPIGLSALFGDAWLSYNQLTSLNRIPEDIDGNLNANDNQISSLRGMPTRIKKSLVLRNNRLKSLLNIAQEIGGDLHISGNDLDSLDGLPPRENIGGTIYIDKKQEKKFKNLLRGRSYKYEVIDT